MFNTLRPGSGYSPGNALASFSPMAPAQTLPTPVATPIPAPAPAPTPMPGHQPFMPGRFLNRMSALSPFLGQLGDRFQQAGQHWGEINNWMGARPDVHGLAPDLRRQQLMDWRSQRPTFWGGQLPNGA